MTGEAPWGARFVLPENQAEMLRRHLDLSALKAVSYLPIRTVERVLGLSLHEYISMIEVAGNKAIVLGADECCIASGAVYAFSPKDLIKILKDSVPLLVELGWPASPGPFIRRLAAEWVDQDSAVLPVIRRAFGDG